MKLRKGDKVTISKVMQSDGTYNLQFVLNGYVQHDSDAEYILKRCGTTHSIQMHSLQDCVEFKF